MADYTDDIATAVEMIEEAGGLFKFEHFTPEVADLTKPWRTEPNLVIPTPSFEALAVMLNFKTSQQSAGFTAGSEDTKFVLPGDMIVYLAAGSSSVSFVPTARDVVTVPNTLERFGVVDNITLAPDGTPILYKLWVRK